MERVSNSPELHLDAENPWPGLSGYPEQGSAFFAGRDREREELYQLIRLENVVVLTGQSGLGKSSLLDAGVAPLLREADFFPVRIRLMHEADSPPYEEQVFEMLRLEAEGRADVEAPLPREGGESLWNYLHREDVEFWSSRNRLLTPVLIFDQFEELFTLGAERGRRAEATRLLALLADLVENRRRLNSSQTEADPVDSKVRPKSQNYRLVLSLRKEFLAELELALSWQMPSIVHNRYHLLAMSGEQALDVVCEPGAAANLVSVDVAERIVGFVAGLKVDRLGFSTCDDDTEVAPAATGSEAEHASGIGGEEIEPALLCLLCRELNAERQRRGLSQITAELVDETQENIVESYYDSCLANMPDGVAVVVEGLVTPSGLRRASDLETARRSPDVSAEHIEKLIVSRLLRTGTGPGGAPTVELMHDCLAPIVLERRNHRKQAEAAKSQMQRRLRWTAAAALTVAFVALAVGVGVALTQRRQALEAQEKAELALQNEQLARKGLVASEAFNAASRAIERGDDSTAMAQLARALKNRPDFQEALRAAGDGLLRGVKPAVAVFDDVGQTTAVVFEEGNSKVLGIELSAAVHHWTIDGDKGVSEVRQLDSPQPFTLASLHPRGQFVVTASLALAEEGKRPASSSLAEKDIDDDSEAGTEKQFTRLDLWSRESDQQKPQASTEIAGRVVALTMSRRDGRVAIVLADGQLFVWDANPYRKTEPKRISDLGGRGTAVAWLGASGIAVAYQTQGKSSEVSQLALLSQDEEGTWRESWSLASEVGAVAQMEFSADRSLLALTTTAGDVSIHEATDGELLRRLDLPAPAVRARFDPLGRRLVTAGRDGAVRVWASATGAAIGQVNWHRDSVGDVRFSDDGRRLVSVGFDNTVRIWSTMSTAAVANEKFEIELSAGVSKAYFGIAADGRKVIVVASDDLARAITVWDAETGEAVGSPMPLEGSPDPIRMSADGHWLSACVDQRLWCWRVGAPLEEGFFVTHPDIVLATAFTEDGEAVLSYCDAGTLTRTPLNDPDGGESVEIGLGGHRIEVSPVGDVGVVVYGEDIYSRAEARLFRVDSLETFGESITVNGYVNNIAFDPVLPRVALPCLDGTVTLFSSETGKALGIRLSHPDGATWAAFRPGNGEEIVTACQDGRLRVWNLERRELIQPDKIMRNAGTISRFSVSEDGKLAATASADGTSRVWNLNTKESLGLPVEHGDTVWSAVFGDQGRTLLTASDDRTARLSRIEQGVMEAVPPWIPDLLYYVAGQRFSEEGSLEPLSVAQSHALKEQLLAQAADGAFARLRDWTLAEGLERHVHPFSDTTHAEVIDRALQRRGQRDLERAFQLDPGNSPVHLASVDYTVDSRAERFLISRSVKAIEESGEGLLLAGEILIEQGNYDEAKALLEREVRRRDLQGSKENPAPVHAIHGAVLLKLELEDEALEAYLRAIEHGVDDPELRSEVGLRLLQLGNREGGERIFEEWLDSDDPHLGENHAVNVAWGALMLDRRDQARGYFEALKGPSTTREEASLGLAILAELDQDSAAADKYYQNYKDASFADGMRMAPRERIVGMDALIAGYESIRDRYAANQESKQRDKASTESLLGRALSSWFNKNSKDAKRLFALVVERDPSYLEETFLSQLDLEDYEIDALRAIIANEEPPETVVGVPEGTALPDRDSLPVEMDKSDIISLAARTLQKMLEGDVDAAAELFAMLVRQAPEYADSEYLSRIGWEDEEIEAFAKLAAETPAPAQAPTVETPPVPDPAAPAMATPANVSVLAARVLQQALEGDSAAAESYRQLIEMAPDYADPEFLRDLGWEDEEVQAFQSLAAKKAR